MRNMTKALAGFLAIAALSSFGCSHKAGDPDAMATPPSAFNYASEYDEWANSNGYEHGDLFPEGYSGIYMDRFMTLPTDAGYESGNIVVGDSRSCQLGIYQRRAGRADFAAFAVWGGHYKYDSLPQIMTESLVSEVEKCFRSQIEANGSSTLFFFATVNDYNYLTGNNDENISAAISAAERFASMEYEYNGQTHKPKVIVIGIVGTVREGVFARDLTAEAFNSCIDDYNEKLKKAVENSPALKEYSNLYTTVLDIVGETGFIDDKLHFDDATLYKLCEYVLKTADTFN